MNIEVPTGGGHQQMIVCGTAFLILIDGQPVFLGKKL